MPWGWEKMWAFISFIKRSLKSCVSVRGVSGLIETVYGSRYVFGLIATWVFAGVQRWFVFKCFHLAYPSFNGLLIYPTWRVLQTHWLATNQVGQLTNSPCLPHSLKALSALSQQAHRWVHYPLFCLCSFLASPPPSVNSLARRFFGGEIFHWLCASSRASWGFATSCSVNRKKERKEMGVKTIVEKMKTNV